MKNLLITLLLIIPLLQLNAQCYELVWQDEFDGAAIDGAKWTYQNGGWNGSNVQNCYDPANASVSNGSLFIESKYEPGFDCFGTPVDFTSGFIQTKNRIDWTFGRFEARVKLAASNSTWPAFWMSPQNSVYGSWPQSGEIDVFEVKGHDMSKSYGNAHWGNSPGDKQQEKKTYNFPAGNGADNWHVYAVEWQLGQLDFYIDGNHYGTINNFDEPNATTHPGPFDIGFYLRLNVAVGGDYLTAPWNDANNGINELPAAMEVDWVRVYQDFDNCPPPTECELVENGNFNDGTNAWSLYKYGSADGTLSLTGNGYAKIDVSNAGTSTWHLALRQTGLYLENGKTYNIRLKAYADAARSCPIIITQSGGAQYAYIAQSLTTTPTVYEYQFTMNAATDANGIFTLNAGNNLADVYVDDISISEISAGTACDDGDACTSNDVYDATCQCEGTYTDQDNDGYCIANDPDDNNPCIPDICPSVCESLQNWNFDDGTNNWTTYEYASADGNLTILPNGDLKLDVITPGSTDWHIALRQNGFLLETGKTYQLRLETYADAPRGGSIIISRAGGYQYANLSQNFTTSPTIYTYQFTMNDPTDPAAIFNLNVGSTAIDAYVSAISISDLTCIQSIACAPNLMHTGSTAVDGTYQAAQSVESDAAIDGNIIYKAGEWIHLKGGFSTGSSYDFSGLIEDCQ